MNPLISIIIPSFNREHLIAETLQSIRAQTYSTWECIIVDDHSTDNTVAVAKEYQQQDERFRVYVKPNDKPKGPSASRNYGLSLAKGSFINWFDSDDLMVSTKLETDLRQISSGNYDFTISQTQFFSHETGEIIGFWNDRLYSSTPINDFIKKKVGWSTNAPLWKKESLITKGLLFNDFLITAEDYLYHIQALQYNLIPIQYPQTLVKQRVHEERLNEFKGKAKFKCYVYRYILEHSNSLKLSQEVYDKVHTMYHNQLSALLLNGQLSKAIRHSLYLRGHFPKKRQTKNLIKLLAAGVFYKITGKGYVYLKNHQEYE